jgi:hypothetical protein
MNSTMSASCSMLPDSRRSDRRGLPSRFSTSRFSWEIAMIGILRSLASAFSPREMSAISCWRFSSRRLTPPRASYR